MISCGFQEFYHYDLFLCVLKESSRKVEDARTALSSTFERFEGNLEAEEDMETLVELQMNALLAVYNIPPGSGNAGLTRVSQQLLHLYRTGRLGRLTLDVVPDSP